METTTKKQKIVRLIRHIISHVCTFIKSYSIGFITALLALIWALPFCKGRFTKLLCIIGASSLGTAAMTVVADNDSQMDQLLDDIEDLRSKKATEK